MKEKTRAKAELRSEIRSLLRDLPATERMAESKAIRDQMTFPAGSKVALFAGGATEVQLLELLGSAPDILWFLPRVISESEMEYLPVTHSSPLKKGAFGIMEPVEGVSTQELDFIICPGLAFTQKGDRLGQGGGFYDRALEKFTSAQLLGVCYQCQLLNEIPTEEHDLRMDQIITSHLGFSTERREYSP